MCGPSTFTKRVYTVVTVTVVMDLLAVRYCAGQPVQGATANSDSSVSGLRSLKVPMTQGIHHSPGPFSPATLCLALVSPAALSQQLRAQGSK